MAILIMHSPRGGDPAYSEWLADLGEELYLLCSVRHAAVATGYAEVHGFENYEVDGAVEMVALAVSDRVHVRAVVANAECDVMRAARLREVLDLPGQSPTSALAFRDKVVMKTYLMAAGIPTPMFRQMADTFDLLAFVRDYGYPVLVKPIDGSGSAGIRVLEAQSDVECFVRDGMPRGFEVERLVDGQLYHVDGLVLDGELVVIQSSRYVPPRGSLAVKDDLPYGSYFLGPLAPLAKRLDRFVEDVLDALPSPKDFTFHAELFHTTADELVFCEIACRTGGCLVREMLRHGLGVDLDVLSVRAQCGLSAGQEVMRSGIDDATRTLAGRVLVPRGRGRLRAIPESAPNWALEYRRTALPGDVFVGTSYDNRKTGDYVAACIVEGMFESEVEERVVDAAKWFGENIVWVSA